MSGENGEVGIENFLRQIASEEGFKDYTLEIKPISSGGANFSSSLYTAKVEDDQNVVNLFVKVAIIRAGLRRAIESLYTGEIHFYSNIGKIFGEIEKKHNVPEEHRYFLPKYYRASIERSKEMLVLEDLSVKGFTTYDRFKSIDWPYASAAVKELAKFHALSMAFEKKYPEIYEKFIDKHGFYRYNEEIFKLWIIPSFHTCVRVVKEENREKLKTFLDSITFSDFLKMFHPMKNKALIHTDYRPSNLMHRSREDDSIQVIPIDYQTFQEGCPVIDMLYFIFTGSDKEFRRQHFDQLMEHYYTELSAAMTRLGIDNSRYSRRDFDLDLKEKLKYGIVLAAQVLPVVTVDPKEASKFTADISEFANIKTSEQLVERINGVVEDFVRWEIL